MQHQDYIREVPGSGLAILMIHGIVGTSNYFQYLMPLVPEDCAYYNILLDGHGKEVLDFGRSSMKKWRTQVFSWLDYILQRHERVIIAGHSLGALFGIEAALKYPGQVVHLFCHGIPICLRCLPMSTVRFWRMLFHKVKPDTPTAKMEAACGFRITWKLWHYLLVIPRLAELLVEMHRAKKLLPLLQTPCHNYQGIYDDVLSRRNSRYLLQFPAIHHKVLPYSGHFRFEPEDRKVVQAEFVQIIEQYR